jgi:RNA recognition motif-containing protein
MGNRLYVGNLPFSITEDSLRAALEETGGTCKDIHIVTDRETGRPRGFAFAEMADEAQAQAAIAAMDGKAAAAAAAAGRPRGLPIYAGGGTEPPPAFLCPRPSPCDQRSMPDTHEKRQRNRRKQQKRKEKLERKLLRKQQKLDANRPLYHSLLRGNDQFRVATDLWLSVLDLAAVGEWTPPVSESEDRPSSASYARPHGLEMTDEDAQGLAKVIETLVPAISDEELPFSNSPFGEAHTEDLLARRAEGEKLPLEDAATAQELLSGPPKKEVELLAEFLKGGALSIQAS